MVLRQALVLTVFVVISTAIPAKVAERSSSSPDSSTGDWEIFAPLRAQKNPFWV
jgi:hypothetical protein